MSVSTSRPPGHRLVRLLTLFILASGATLFLSSASKWANEPSNPADKTSQRNAPAELGRVAWLRSYAKASERAAREQKPLFVLFQEVPGCATCVAFGQTVLDHPLLIEAIEDEFVPVAILNNLGGEDRRTLERFGEPAWNNPVVRFIDADGNDLIPRKDRLWRPYQIADRMIAALETANRPVPRYLRDLAVELGPRKVSRATLSMHCYWRGEACLGDLDGVVATRTGDLGGREVVEAEFDSSRTSYAKLLRAAKKRGCVDGVFAENQDELAIAKTLFGSSAQAAEGPMSLATARNQKFHLKRTKWTDRIKTLTPAQATRLNALAWTGGNPESVLSPRQKAAAGLSASN